MIATPMQSVRLPLLSLFDSCDYESDLVNLTTCDVAGSSTLFGWSDIPCLDDNEFSFNSDVFHVEEYPLSSYRNVIPMDEDRCFATRSNTSKSHQISHCDNSIDTMMIYTKSLHERSSSVDSIIEAVQNKKPRTKTTSVAFADTVSIREYNIVPGMHPCCVDGLAIELGWDYTDETDLMKHELLPEQRSVSAGRRRVKSVNCFRLNYFDRRERLERMTGKSELQMLRELHH